MVIVYRKDCAFSGLEAAIVLIAFVVVAAVFAFTMLSAGFFATSKSQEVTYSGIKSSSTNLVQNGAMYGTMDANDNLGELIVYFYNPEGSQSIAIDDIIFLITVRGGAVEDATPFTSGWLPGDIIPPGTKAQFYVHFGQYNSMTGGPKAGETFTLEVKPPVGGSTFIQRKLADGYEGGCMV